MTFPPEIEQRLSELRQEFVSQTRIRVDEMSDLLQESDQGDARALIKSALHDLKGQAATFGFPLVSDIARVAESYAATTPNDDAAAVRELGALFETIRNLLDEGQETANTRTADLISSIPLAR